MNLSALPGGRAESSRRPGSLLPDAHPAADPTGEVRALLDDLAPACDSEDPSGSGFVECQAPAEWVVWAECSASDRAPSASFLCSFHLGDDLAGRTRHAHCVARGFLIPTRTERIRSKPTT